MEPRMKLSEYGRRMGVCYRTVHEWWKAGKIPGAYKSESGSVFVKMDPVQAKPDGKTVVYCRVSNQSRRAELEYQVNRCLEFCSANGWTVSSVYKEVASGMNDSRTQLWKMLDGQPSRIVVENKDRLTRFGFEYLSRLQGKLGCEVVVMNPAGSDEQDLVKDLVSVITSFCCRLYGLRRTKNKVERIKALVHEA